MRAQGLALGGSLDNAIVMDEYGVLNSTGCDTRDELSSTRCSTRSAIVPAGGTADRRVSRATKPGHASTTSCCASCRDGPRGE